MSNVKVTMDVLGRIKKIETEGFVGASCKDMTQALEHAINPQAGSKVLTETEYKAEFYEYVGAAQTQYT